MPSALPSVVVPPGFHLLSGLELLTSQLLLGHFLHLNLFLTTRYNLFFLRQNHFDVTRTAHVGVDSSVGTVRTTSHVRSPVHLNVIDHKGIHVKSLYISIRFCILQKLQQELSGLDGPSSLRAAMSFSLSLPADTSTESSERNDLFLQENIFEICVGFPDVHLLDRLSCFA